MRLSPIERTALQYALKGTEGSVFLIGSRVDPNRKGGDIDLLIFTEYDPFLISQRVATRFFSQCEEKIDVYPFQLSLSATVAS